MKNRPLDSTDFSWLARLARALLGEVHAADDLVQETAVAALSADLPTGGARRAWLGSVARRLAARHYRREARRTRRERETARAETLPDSTELVERAEVAEMVTAAARRLPEPFRRTILLRFLESLSPEEIARVDGKRADTVRWRVRRGLELLRQELVRRSDRDWSSWSALLVPLAHSHGGVGLAATGTSGAFAGWVASLIAMKATTLLAAAVLVTAGLLVWISTTPDSIGGPSMSDEPLAASTLRVEPEPLGSERPADNERKSVATGSEGPTKAAGSTQTVARGSLFGRVVDDVGEPVRGATVYLVPAVGPDQREVVSATVVAQTTSDMQGTFRIDLPAGTATLDLGVAANGFLRQMVVGAWPARSGDELVVALERGRRIIGVVVDDYDRPVPGLGLLCHTARAGIQHVSPSQTTLRSERAVLGDAASRYQQCRGKTDGSGTIEFRGLPSEELVVLSLAPGWTIKNPQVAAADTGYLTWIAKRRLGVRLTVVDTHTRRPVDLAYATFRYQLTFADGEVGDYGQWVGRGRGGATFVVTPEVLPGLDDRVVTHAVFYGTAGTFDARVEWQAEPIADLRGASGVAEVRVAIDTLATGSQTRQPPPTAMLDLDVRYADGSPFDRELAVGWRAQPDLGSVREDSGLAERLAPGRYRMELVAGDVELRVADSTASGSLGPWTSAMRCEADRRSIAFVTLPRGASATIPKPPGWRGEWYLHASWRPSPTAEWRGSWNYSTRKDEIVLTALRPAEWRFELRRDSERGPDPLVRIARLGDGVDVVVDTQ